MTDVEFLDDIERRGTNGDTFTRDELNRLYRILRWGRTVYSSIYMSTIAVALARTAREQCKRNAIERIKESQ
jgi:hypothetical protein